MPSGFEATNAGRLQFTSSRALACVLGQLSVKELAAYEAGVADLITDEILSSERKAPGYLAARLIDQIDERPTLVCGIPAYLVGGREFLNGSVQDIDWAAAREEVAAQMKLCFSRIAAGHRPYISGHPRHDVRVLKLAQAVWFLFRIRDQAARGKLS